MSVYVSEHVNAGEKKHLCILDVMDIILARCRSICGIVLRRKNCDDLEKYARLIATENNCGQPYVETRAECGNTSSEQSVPPRMGATCVREVHRAAGSTLPSPIERKWTNKQVHALCCNKRNCAAAHYGIVGARANE